MDKKIDHLSIKQQLEKKSNFFCPAKWNELYLYLNHGNSNSCHHPIPHEIPRHLLSDPFVLHNTPHKIEMQKLMMQGQRPEECHMCWHIEDASPGMVSDRFIKSARWKDCIDTLEIDPHHVPQFIEIVFDNLCNLNCSYCDSGQSSSWATRIKNNPMQLETDYRELYRQIHIAPGSIKNDYLEAWLQWWPMISNHVHTLKVSGGEPLISPNFWRFFEVVGHSPQLKLGINSNMCVDQKRLESFKIKAEDFQSVRISASIDGQGKIAEYSRLGLRYELFLENCEYWCSTTPSNCTLNLQSTINILSVWGFKDFLQLAASLRTKYPNKINTFYATLVRFPEFQSVSLLSKNIKHQLAAEIEDVAEQFECSFDALEKSYIQKIVGYLQNDPKPLVSFRFGQLKKDLRLFLKAYDQFGSLRYQHVLPEIFSQWLDIDD